MNTLSVIIPFHRELELIGRATESALLNSTAVDSIQIIICNDGSFSEEDIRARLSKCANRHSTVVANRYKKGPGGARNTGLDVASGSIIAFLDADDYWLPGKIEAQLCEINKGATFVATAYRFNESESVVCPPRSINNPLDIFRRRGIGTSTVAVTRPLLGTNRFRDMRFAQDIDFWFALANNHEFRYSSIDTCFVAYDTGGTTKNKLVQFIYMNNVLKINEVPFFTRVSVLLSYTIAGIINHFIKAKRVHCKRLEF